MRRSPRARDRWREAASAIDESAGRTLVASSPMDMQTRTRIGGVTIRAGEKTNKKRAVVSRRRASTRMDNTQIDNNFRASCAVATGLPYSAHSDATRLTNCALLFASVSLSQRTLSSSPVRQCPPNCNVQ